MKIDRATSLQIVLAILSCPFVPIIISGTWALGFKIFLIVFAYLGLLCLYILWSWKYKEWDTASSDAEVSPYAKNFSIFIDRTHYFYIRAFLLMQLLGSLIIITQTHLPEYAATKISATIYEDSLAQNPFSKSDIRVVADTTTNTKSTSYVGTLNAKGSGSIYPVNAFLSYKMPIFLQPLWDMIGSLWLLFLIFFLFMLLAEAIANIFMFPKKIQP